MNETLFVLLDGKVKKNDLLRLSESNLDASDLLKIKLKSPFLGLIFAIFLGFLGVCRFYKGDKLLGFFKALPIIFCIFILIVAFMSAILNIDFEYGYEIMEMLNALSNVLWVYNLYLLVDVYFVYVGIKEDNFKKITDFLKEKK